MNGPPRHGPLAALKAFDALLALEDGSFHFGHACGAPGEAAGEIVFNTSMTGYPEIITDPSYRGQIVTFTYPLIGNYGVNTDDAESPKPQLSGVIVRSMCGEPSSWRSRESLPDYLRRHRIVAIEGIDTRALTRRIRSAGVMRAVLSTRDLDPASLVARAQRSRGLAGRDLVAEVTLLEPTPWLKPAADEREAASAESVAPAADRLAFSESLTPRATPLDPRWLDDPAPDGDPASLAIEAMLEARREGRALVLPSIPPVLKLPRKTLRAAAPALTPAPTVTPAAGIRGDADFAAPRIAILHCGMKANIAGELRKRGAAVKLYPAATPIAAILGEKPDGLVISNGPGDPAGVEGVVDGVRAALGRLPVFGICLGIQMIALAFGGRTYKLKFGHRGANQPVLDLVTGRVEITSQNHGYAVDPASLEPTGADDPRAGLVITHTNLNDGTVEGFAHDGLGVIAVQYHPEAAPGPHDSAGLFDRFLTTVRKQRAARAGRPAGVTGD